ncbi:MAG: hypothetical protein K8R23_08865 [Chthoniobacter sp.]|nr:hypothetical protein [Chthoniobacter sp.]
MKELTAFVLLLVLIGMGWNQSYRTQYDRLVGNPPPPTPPPVKATPAPPTLAADKAATGPGAAVVAPPATPRDTSWMWDKKPGTPPLPAPGNLGGAKHAR